MLKHRWIYDSRKYTGQSAFVVEVLRYGSWEIDYPVAFNNHKNAVKFMRETYGTDIYPLYVDEETATLFEDSCGNCFAISLFLTFGDRL
jgi:hypothetical protein